MGAGLQEYCIAKDHFEFVLDVTKFKTQAAWGQDPFKPVAATVKSAFTRGVSRRFMAGSHAVVFDLHVRRYSGRREPQSFTAAPS